MKRNLSREQFRSFGIDLSSWTFVGNASDTEHNRGILIFVQVVLMFVQKEVVLS